MLIEVAILPIPPSDQTKILEVLADLAPNDRPFGVKVDPESGQFLLLADSEEQLGALLGRFRQTTDLKIDVGAPQVSYRETLSKPVSITYTHKKQTGGSGQFAEVSIAFEPLPPNSGFVFENKAADGSIPPEFIPAVEKGLKAQKECGLLAGFPVIDFKAILTDGKYHEADSSALAFDIAARAAFREIASKGVVKLLEPFMKVEVTTPDDFLGGVIGDINSRRGQVESTDSSGREPIIIATVPLANMFGYSSTLRAMTQGLARYSMEFARYEKARLPDDDDPNFPPAIGMRVTAA